MPDDEITLNPGSPAWLADLSKHFTDETRAGLRKASNELLFHREIAQRLTDLRSATGRVDLTDSSKRAEVYALVSRAKELLKTGM